MSHHPPAAAHHAFSEKGWTLRQEITLASKFRGKYLSIMPVGKRVQWIQWMSLLVTTVLAFSLHIILHTAKAVEYDLPCLNSLKMTIASFNMISCVSPGPIQCIFEKSNNHYSWKKVTTTVHNIIVGKLWIDQVNFKMNITIFQLGIHPHLIPGMVKKCTYAIYLCLIQDHTYVVFASIPVHHI